MNRRNEGVPAGGRVSRVHGRVGPDLGLTGLAREASTLCGNLLLNLALCWCRRAYGRKGGHGRESGIGGSAHAISLSVPPKTATKFDDAVNQSLGQTPWPDLSVLGVVAGDVDVLVPAGAAEILELRQDLTSIAHETCRLLQYASASVPQAQLALVEDDLVHRGVCQHLWPGRLGVEPGWLGLLVDEVGVALELQ